jgi:hypothetical protein
MFGFILVGGICWAVYLGYNRQKEEPNTVDYHLAALNRIQKNGILVEPENLKGYLSANAFNWIANGRPTFKAQIHKIQHHRDALLRLGYLEKRKFELKGKNLRPVNSNIFSSFTNQGGAILLSIAQFYDESSLQIHVISRKSDMPSIEKIIKGLNASPQSPTNRPVGTRSSRSRK